jgi:nicotinamidase-related amidase
MLIEHFPTPRKCAWTQVFGPKIPTLVLIDLQREYVSEGRALNIRGAGAALSNCAKAIAHARAIGLPIAFFRLNLESSFFNPSTQFSQWIDGFRPHGCDYVFDRQKPSCYASTAFSDTIARSGGHLVIAGFSGDGACLATAVDAFNRDHSLVFLSDASATQAFGSLKEGESHSAITALIELYGRSIKTEEWIVETKALTVDGR